MASVAVIGAGLSGLVIARELSTEHDVTVLEKSRGVGGRIATRYADAFEFDHGAQFFTARSPSFRAFLQPLVDAGVVADWPARFAELQRSKLRDLRQWDQDYPHYVGTPRMNTVGKWLARGLNVHVSCEVERVERHGGRWRPLGTQGEALGHFDWLVLTVPATQTAALAPAGSRVHHHAAAARMHACYALMLGFDAPITLPWDAALVRDADISWVSVNSSKPGRPAASCLVVHSTNAWADAHLDDDIAAVKAHITAECAAVTRLDVGAALVSQLQRWRYANIGKQTGEPYSLDGDLNLAACGDWHIRGRVEAAFLSAQALAEALRSRL